MRQTRLLRQVLLPVGLLALLVSLAALQYRWVGAVSQAERAEMQESLDRRAREFANEFDREISRVYTAFQRIADQTDEQHPDLLASRFDEWRSGTPFPALVKRVFFTRPVEKGEQLYVYQPDARVFERAEWPAELERVRHHVSLVNTPFGQGPTGASVMAFTNLSLMADLPALLIPAGPRPRADMMEIRQEEQVRRELEAKMQGLQKSSGRYGEQLFDVFRFQLHRNYLIVQLDNDVIRNVMLPLLVERHFPDSERYRVAILDHHSSSVLTRNTTKDTIDRPDVTATFFMLRPELAIDSASPAMPTPPAAIAGAVGRRTAPAVESRQQFSVVVTGAATPARAAMRLGPGWRVHLQHRAGSLEAAVADARRRNLYISFGILATLAASVGLIVFNARRSEKLAAQQMDFVAAVSHELRTPLAVIRSAAQNLSAGVVAEPDQARRYGDLIETEGRRLTDMVEQVLDYAGLSGNRRVQSARPHDAGAIAADVASACRSLDGAAGVTIDVSIDDHVPLVLADEQAIRRALTNLVTNALKYGADGRWIGITVRAAGPRGKEDVQISVSDKGRGIDPHDLPHLFEPFYRGQQAVERQIHGNGLGLNLVKRIAEAHGGRVTVKSAPGEGATFVLHLPAASAEPVTALGDADAVPSER